MENQVSAPVIAQPKMINVFDPDSNEIGSIQESQLPTALSQGLSRATPEQVDNHFKQQEFGTVPQQIATGLEGAASALTMGLSTGAETGLGFSTPEKISARREVNPGVHALGQAAGLGIGMLTGTGEAALLEGAGAGTAKALGLGLENAGALSKIGSAAVKSGIENALFQSGDEISKMFSHDSDPNAPIQTAMTDIGLSGLFGAGLGGGLGSVSELWKATVGKKAAQFLDTVKNKAGGIDGQTSEPVRDALAMLGIDVSPEVRAMLSNNPELQQHALALSQSDLTSNGVEFQKSLGSFKKALNEASVYALGKTPEELAAMPEFSKYESGKDVGQTLAREVQERIDPLSQEFEVLKERHADAELIPDTEVINSKLDPNQLQGLDTIHEKSFIPGTASTLGEHLTAMADREGWLALPDSDVMKLYNKAMRALPRQKTIKDMGNLITQIGNEANGDILNGTLRRAGGMITSTLREGEAEAVMHQLGREGPELVDRYRAARSAWSEQSKIRAELDDRLKIGGSLGAYARNIGEMASTDGEALLRKISGKNDAALLTFLEQHFPETANALRRAHVDSVLSTAIKKARPGEEFNAKALLGNVKNMSPEMRAFSLSPETIQKLEAIDTVLDHMSKIDENKNFSNTARTWQKMSAEMLGGAGSMAGMIIAHNPALGYVMGKFADYFAKNAPDALRMGMLKFMGSNGEISSVGFKSMVDTIEAASKGEKLLNKYTKDLFNTGKMVLPEKAIDSQNEKLDKKLKELQVDPSKIVSMGKDMHYMPDHTAALSQTAAGAAAYLNSLRPNLQKQAPLDKEPKENAVQKAKFERALTIANNPLTVIQSAKEGTISPSDVTTLKAVAPALYQKMADKINEQLVDHLSKEGEVPYKTRLGLAVFLGQPLDSTMMAAGIMATQATFIPKQQQAHMPQGHQTGSLKSIHKMAGNVATPSQAREMERTKKA